MDQLKKDLLSIIWDECKSVIIPFSSLGLGRSKSYSNIFFCHCCNISLYNVLKHNSVCIVSKICRIFHFLWEGGMRRWYIWKSKYFFKHIQTPDGVNQQWGVIYFYCKLRLCMKEHCLYTVQRLSQKWVKTFDGH